jgi:hypothetical protein
MFVGPKYQVNRPITSVTLQDTEPTETSRLAPAGVPPAGAASDITSARVPVVMTLGLMWLNSRPRCAVVTATLAEGGSESRDYRETMIG